MIQKTINEIMEEYRDDMLEEETYRNIVLYIRRESLLRIMSGERAVHVIPTSNQRAKLLRDNVLEEVYMKGGKHIIVSDRARRLLEEER